MASLDKEVSLTAGLPELALMMEGESCPDDLDLPDPTLPNSSSLSSCSLSVGDCQVTSRSESFKSSTNVTRQTPQLNVAAKSFIGI